MSYKINEIFELNIAGFHHFVVKESELNQKSVAMTCVQSLDNIQSCSL